MCCFATLRRPGVLLWGLALACAAGCSGFRNGGGWTAWRLSDPPQLSPYSRPLGGGVPAESARPLSPAESSSPQTPPPETTSPQSAPATTTPSATPGDEGQTIRQRLEAPPPAGSIPEGPKLGGIETLDWTLQVSAPESATTGELVSFQIQVTNHGAAAATDVVLECEFDAGLAFPGRTERQIRQPLDRVAAGEKRSVALSLELRETGRQCARFSITQGGKRMAQREACVEARSPAIDVSISGPDESSVGGRAEYVVTIVNRSSRDVAGVSATLVHDSSLALRAASTGAQRGENQVQWDLETLHAGERVQIETEFECLSEQAAAKVTATVNAESLKLTQHKELRIAPADQPQGPAL
jgi:uncharacterized repeat protein (TIGR01451 family)